MSGQSRSRPLPGDPAQQRQQVNEQPGVPGPPGFLGRARTWGGSGNAGPRSRLARLLDAGRGTRPHGYAGARRSRRRPAPPFPFYLGAEEPDIPQDLYERLRRAGVEPAVGPPGRKLAGDQFQAKQFDVIAAKYQVLSPERLEDA